MTRNFTSGITEVGQDPVPVCPVPGNGVRVKNLGPSLVYLGGPGTDSTAGTGYPLEAGTSEDIPGALIRESPLVPAPDDDMGLPLLYARTEPGSADSKVSWISAP